MHELAICQALIRQVEAVAAQRGATAVQRVVIEVGPLSGVEPPLLARAFTVARAGTCAEHAGLTMEHSPLEIHCRSCGHDGPAKTNRLICEACGDWRVRVVRGEDLMLLSIELETPGRSQVNPSKEAHHV